MAKIGVSLKINVSQIDKNRLFNGQKGNYLDATVFIDIDQLDQFGNSGMITQDVSKEEKGQNVRGAILGNCKVFWSDGGQQQQAPQQRAPQQQQGSYQQPQQQSRSQPQQQSAQQQVGFQRQPMQGNPTGQPQQSQPQQAGPDNGDGYDW